MKSTLYFDFAGISFRVRAGLNEGLVEDVGKVEVISNTGKYVPVQCDTEQFFTDMQDYLNEAVENAILDERLAHEDMLFETAREEGRL